MGVKKKKKEIPNFNDHEMYMWTTLHIKCASIFGIWTHVEQYKARIVDLTLVFKQ